MLGDIHGTGLPTPWFRVPGLPSCGETVLLFRSVGLSDGGPGNPHEYSCRWSTPLCRSESLIW